MNDTIVETVRPHLPDRQAGVLERHSIYINRLAVGIVDRDRLRYGIDDAAKLVRVLQALPLFPFSALTSITATTIGCCNSGSVIGAFSSAYN
jgi:hypothetical protein